MRLCAIKNHKIPFLVSARVSQRLRYPRSVCHLSVSSFDDEFDLFIVGGENGDEDLAVPWRRVVVVAVGRQDAAQRGAVVAKGERIDAAVVRSSRFLRGI